jgi:hypothetical protein
MATLKQETAVQPPYHDTTDLAGYYFHRSGISARFDLGENPQ